MRIKKLFFFPFIFSVYSAIAQDVVSQARSTAPHKSTRINIDAMPSVVTAAPSQSDIKASETHNLSKGMPLTAEEAVDGTLGESAERLWATKNPGKNPDENYTEILAIKTAMDKAYRDGLIGGGSVEANFVDQKLKAVNAGWEMLNNKQAPSGAMEPATASEAATLSTPANTPVPAALAVSNPESQDAMSHSHNQATAETQSPSVASNGTLRSVWKDTISDIRTGAEYQALSPEAKRNFNEWVANMNDSQIEASIHEKNSMTQNLSGASKEAMGVIFREGITQEAMSALTDASAKYPVGPVAPLSGAGQIVFTPLSSTDSVSFNSPK
ncbi:MAG: hypothetical protein R3A80_07420 [Bdellovibrionota bacterium]